MKRFIKPLLTALKYGGNSRRRLIHQPLSSNTLHPHDEKAVAQQLCRTLDRAVQLGLWEHANRVAATAARIAQQSPQLTERLTRLAMMRKDFETALAIIEACPARTSLVSLLRVLCMIKTGRIAEAHLEVFRWSRQPAVPPTVRLVQALLEWHAGDPQSSIAALLIEVQENRPPDLRVLALLVAVCTAAGRNDLARAWSHRLRTVVADQQGANHTECNGSSKAHHDSQPMHPGWSPDVSVPSEQLAHSWLTATVDQIVAEALWADAGVDVRRESATPGNGSPEPAILSIAPQLGARTIRATVKRRRQAA